MTYTVKVSDLQNDFLRLIEEAEKTGEPIVLTQDGEPVAQVVPMRRRPQSLYGAMKGHITILSDLDEPIDVEWDAMK